MEENKTKTNTKILTIQIPVWQEGVWTALQRGDFFDAGVRLQDFLEFFTDDGLELVNWIPIIEGSPAIRGGVTETDWKEKFLPILGTIFLNFSNPYILSSTYFGLEKKTLNQFHLLVVNTIPGETDEKKLSFLKEFNLDLYKYFLGTPSQIIGLGILKNVETNELVNRVKEKFISERSKDLLFSTENALSIFEFCTSLNLSEKQTSIIAEVFGLMFIKEITNVAGTEKISSFLNSWGTKKEMGEIEKFFNETLLDIPPDTTTTTISLENFSDTTPQDFTPVKINVDGSVDNTPKKIEVTDEPAPLVIHREKPQAPTQGGSQISGSSQQTKGFSLPFGFFKQKVVQTQTTSAPVKATVEFLKKDELKRAVDYSELRTPLTPFSKKEEGFIKTEEQKTQNNSQPVTQKINPLSMFGGAQTSNIQKTSVLPTQKVPTPNGSVPQPRSTSEQITNKGVLDIRTSVFDNKESRISNYNKEIIPTPDVLLEIKKQPIMDVQIPLSKSFPVPEKPKIPVINNPQKQNAPIEQKKEPTSPTSGKGFVWFKKPQTPNNNMEKTGPKVEGNTVDLRSNT
ncbi:MAG: hypothetical protein AB1333_03590 [Patescibacteria group bacterium]